MNERRIFLRAGAVSLLGLGAGSTVAQSLPVTPPLRTKQPGSPEMRGYELTNGGTSDKRQDGRWRFWARIVNLDNYTDDINATLQVATDRRFTQIVDALPVKLMASKSFIAETVYSPNISSTQLYYRYVVNGNASVAPSVSGKVRSIAPWNYASTEE